MSPIVQLILQIVNNISEMLNRESQADEKIKDTSIKSTRDLKKAVVCARQIFDGKRNFQGLDVLLKDKLTKEDYEIYVNLRKRFNKFS